MTTTDELLRYNLTRNELLNLKRLINMLHADFHNPGAANYMDPNYDIDYETDNAIYAINHVLECNMED